MYKYKKRTALSSHAEKKKGQVKLGVSTDHWTEQCDPGSHWWLLTASLIWGIKFLVRHLKNTRELLF